MFLCMFVIEQLVVVMEGVNVTTATPSASAKTSRRFFHASEPAFRDACSRCCRELMVPVKKVVAYQRKPTMSMKT